MFIIINIIFLFFILKKIIIKDKDIKNNMNSKTVDQII